MNISIWLRRHSVFTVFLKFEDKIPASLVKFSMGMCDKYTKIAKEKKIEMDQYEVEINILK